MGNLKLVGWVSFDSEYPMLRRSNEEYAEMLRMVFEDIEANGYVFSGEEHQNSLSGMPLFSDGTCLRMSMRFWAKLMADFYVKEDGSSYSYMDFYMSLDDSKLPEPCTIEVAPKECEEQFIGFTAEEDIQIISEALHYGMPFMTTDKVLRTLYELNKQ